MSSETEDYKAALALEQKLAHEAWLAERFGVKPPRSWQECVIRWGKEKGGKRSWQTDAIRLRWWHPHLGAINDIRSINRDMIHTILGAHRPISMIEAIPANSTANRQVAVVQSILNAACREWDWIERSPKLRTYKEPDGRMEWLTVQQWRALASELPEHLRRAATFSLATGLRREKVFLLRWNQVDLARRVMSFTGTSNKLGNTIPLNETAMSLLREIRSSGNVLHIERVFCWRDVPLESYGRAWDKAKERAGVRSPGTACATPGPPGWRTQGFRKRFDNGWAVGLAKPPRIATRTWISSGYALTQQ